MDINVYVTVYSSAIRCHGDLLHARAVPSLQGLGTRLKAELTAKLDSLGLYIATHLVLSTCVGRVY